MVLAASAVTLEILNRTTILKTQNEESHWSSNISESHTSPGRLPSYQNFCTHQSWKRCVSIPGYLLNHQWQKKDGNTLINQWIHQLTSHIFKPPQTFPLAADLPGPILGLSAPASALDSMVGLFVVPLLSGFPMFPWTCCFPFSIWGSP